MNEEDIKVGALVSCAVCFWIGCGLITHKQDEDFTIFWFHPKRKEVIDFGSPNASFEPKELILVSPAPETP
mgnify:CR=1 FL=1|tara:strand:- start:861 stop:1073 length:213 start_codon:yes stop_codon:yes gene_type:complete